MNPSVHNYRKGLAWFFASLCISAINDALTKQLVTNIHYWQITCGRLLFGTLALLPYAITQPSLPVRKNASLHLIRGTIFILAIALWSHGLSTNSNTTATVISFTIPMFGCVLSVFFLKEKITQRLALAILASLIGLLIILYPQHHTFNRQAFAFVLAALLFATLDVLNKYAVTDQPIHTVILYANMVGLAITLPIAFYVAKPPHPQHFFWLALLGLGGNAIIFCLLKAYQYTTLISLTPIRYVELLLSIPISILFFKKTPYHEIYAALFIIPAVLSLIYEQQKKEKPSFAHQ